jgi:hypothetical protein
MCAEIAELIRDPVEGNEFGPGEELGEATTHLCEPPTPPINPTSEGCNYCKENARPSKQQLPLRRITEHRVD